MTVFDLQFENFAPNTNLKCILNRIWEQISSKVRQNQDFVADLDDFLARFLAIKSGFCRAKTSAKCQNWRFKTRF